MMGVFHMSKRRKFNIEEKMYSVNQVLQGKNSRNAEAKRIGVDYWTMNDWVHRFERGGIERLGKLKNWTIYSDVIKLNAIKAVLQEGKSIRTVIKEYDVSSSSLLRGWISKYNKGNDIKSTRKGSSTSKMIKGRKTTFKERIEIVQHALAHKLDYEKTMGKYQVSYQQAYSWVHKYQSLGEDGLKDGRGRKKKTEELTELDRLKLENKKLQAEIEQLEMEVAIQKKLQEIRRRFKH